MASTGDLVPDWRDEGAYAPLLAADRSIFAWEWLRRHPGYRHAVMAQDRSSEEKGPSAWGLHRFVPPHLAAPLARPFWLMEVHPAVLPLRARGAPAGPEALDIRQFLGLESIAGQPGREHVLISDGLHAVRLDVIEGTFADGPAHCDYLISGLAAAEPRLLTLRRLLSLWRHRRFSRMLHPPEPRARRWVLMLRCLDALEAGARQRDIADGLLGGVGSGPDWRGRAPSLRLQAQRLAASARHMAGASYLALLR